MIKQMWPLIEKSKLTSFIGIYLHFKLVNIRMNNNQINFLFMFLLPCLFPVLLKHAITILVAVGMTILTKSDFRFITIHTLNLVCTSFCNWEKICTS